MLGIYDIEQRSEEDYIARNDGIAKYCFVEGIGKVSPVYQQLARKLSRKKIIELVWEGKIHARFCEGKRMWFHSAPSHFAINLTAEELEGPFAEMVKEYKLEDGKKMLEYHQEKQKEEYEFRVEEHNL